MVEAPWVSLYFVYSALAFKCIGRPAISMPWCQYGMEASIVASCPPAGCCAGKYTAYFVDKTARTPNARFHQEGFICDAITRIW